MTTHRGDGAGRGGRRPATKREERRRKQGVFTKRSPSAREGIADALVIKDRDLFFLCSHDGQVPVDDNHGLGLYYDDCRFLGGYELRLGRTRPIGLAATAREGNAMTLELTNPELRGRGTSHVERERVSMDVRRALDGRELTLVDDIRLDNYGPDTAAFDISARFDAEFRDVFDIRGLLKEHPGQLHEPEWRKGRLGFRYDGVDDRQRATTVTFDPPPDEHAGTTARWRLSLEPQEGRDIRITLTVKLGDRHGRQIADSEVARDAAPKPRAGAKAETTAGDSAADRFARVVSDSRSLDEVVDRALRDLQILRSDNAGAEYFAAGVPWFVALFGRDSAITALETLAFDPFVAEQTLRVLAEWQGTQVDDYTEEQPGRILHELRVGELAASGAIPHSPFYGSVDSTPLFCILMARHARWTGRLDVFRELREMVDAALGWIDRSLDERGFLSYRSSTGRGLVNQGWKDSGNAIVNADGSMARPPIALVEVQGYVHAARVELADLFERDDQPERAAELRRAADELRRRFEERFWLEDLGTYALALQRGGDPVAVATSNPGHALWSGIAGADRAGAVRDSLLSDALFSGWGVRTLAKGSTSYNPVAYHLGTVWPHDNAIIAAGLHRYGFDAEARRIADAIFDAAMHMPGSRLPELFTGFDRARLEEPVRYPVACHPQAWAAGAVPSLLTTILGLEPDGFRNELRIVRPALPEAASRLELKGLRVGSGSCDLRFRRTDGVETDVLRTSGGLHVVVEPDIAR